ncbi:TPA: hypothetical protein HA241_02925 [Candidatus Woesearchaeota archaeon]|nr:hypothetical protein [Candidatus Woesearchaeota archaeon]
MNEVNALIQRIKSNDKKVRYQALEQVMKLSRSNKRKQKAVFLSVLHEKALSEKWEERYISMYTISRFMWKNGCFDDFKETYNYVLKLLEDQDGRVRIAAFNALENFRGFFIACVYGGLTNFPEKDIVKLWLDSLILLWDKTKSIKEGKQQYFLMKCVDTLFRPDMESYLNNKEYKKYMEIWEKLQELNEEYDESGGL